MFPKLLVLSALPSAVNGHGFMVTPTIRNIASPPFKYEPQSLGAFGPGKDIEICGKGKAANHQKGDKIVKLPNSGSEFKFEAKITAHHKGHMIVRVCPLITGKTERTDLSKCIRLSGEEGDTWPLSADPGTKEWVATLPSKAELEALNSPKGVFTVQWRYNTANSCEASSSLEPESNCNEKKCCSEVFTNCADVIFADVDSDTSGEVPVDPPKPRPRPRPGPGGSGRPRPGRPSGGGSKKCVAGGAFAGQTKIDKWCARNKKCGDDGEGTCDCSCGTETKPEPEPEAEAEPEPEAEPDVDHVVEPSKAASEIFQGLEDFCKENKAYYCDTQHTQDMAPGLCDCTPVGAESNLQVEVNAHGSTSQLE